MNKKILSIFALIMALSFAVSCSNEDKSGAGGNNGGGTGTGLTLTVKSGAVSAPLTANTAAAAVVTTAFSVNEDDTGVTYTVKSAEGLANAPSGATAVTGTVKDLSKVTDIDKTTKYSIKANTDKNKIEIAQDVATAINTAVGTTKDDGGYIKLVITAKKDSKTCDLEVYIAITKG